MARFVIKESESLSDFLSVNELKKGDILEFKSPSQFYIFSMDREFFELDDPDYVSEDDILSINEADSQYIPMAILEYMGDKHFKSVDMMGEDFSTIYGVLSLVHEDEMEYVDNDTLHFIEI